MFSVIWLDVSINDNQQIIDAQKRLHTAINQVRAFKEVDQCEQHIRYLSRNDQVVLIVGSRLGRRLIPRVHQLRQVSSIYVYCRNKRNEEWTNLFEKVKCVTEELSEIVSLVLALQKRQRNHHMFNEPLSFNTFKKTDDQEQSTTEINGQFIHSQLLIDCLIRMRPSSKDTEEFIAHIKKDYASDECQLKIIREFERDYSPAQALRWYTRDCFLYRQLNKALRVQNVDMLFLLRFFIRDIHQKLAQNQCSTAIRVYRGQLISKEELRELKHSVGQLISMNSFLSTSLDGDLARFMLGDPNVTNTGLQPVLFEIDVDSRLEGIKPFANITAFSYIVDEEEILMMLGSIFRLIHIHPDGRVWIVRMKLCGDNDHNLKPLYNHMKDEYSNDGATNVGSFASILVTMGKLDDAERYYFRFLDELPLDHYNTGVCYHHLGLIAASKGDYDSSLEWYDKSLQVQMRILEPYHPAIATVYVNIGSIYLKKGNYKRALKSYNKSLEIFMQSEDHTKVAACLINISAVYVHQKMYLKALEYSNKGLIIQQKHLPVNHNQLGDSYTNIGSIHRFLGHSKHALEHYKMALKIFAKSLPPQHSKFAKLYNNMGAVYSDERKFQQALWYLEKAATILRRTLPLTHPDIVTIEQSIRKCRRHLK